MMTLHELNEHRLLRMKRMKVEEMLEAITAKASPHSPVISDMPHSQSNGDKVCDLAIELFDIESRIAFYDKQITKEEGRVNSFIESFDDDFVRMAIRLRFIRCLTWERIAIMLDAGTENSIKKLCYRHIKNKEK